MHLRIYIWLSCVLLAGYVRATEESIDTIGPEIRSAELQNDQQPGGAKEVYSDDDDDGSGVEPDESSGSGWGAGPGVDDEDGRGSGDSPGLTELPEDDEDFAPRATSHVVSSTVLYDTSESTDTEAPQLPEVPQLPESTTPTPTTTESSILRIKQFNVETVPNVKAKPESEEVDRPATGEETPSRPEQTDISISGEELVPSTDQDQAGSNVNTESRPPDNVVYIMNTKAEDRATSFFAQPGILAAVIGGAVVGLLCAILVVMFIVYRMRKKDEGSYALDEPKRSPAAASYGKGHNNREFYA